MGFFDKLFIGILLFLSYTSLLFRKARRIGLISICNFTSHIPQVNSRNEIRFYISKWHIIKIAKKGE